MSVKVSTLVWDDPSIKSRTELLVMLAIADNADDYGVAYPGIERLAAKSRCTQRAVQKVISRLTMAGKLSVEYNASRFKTNVYKLYPGTPNGVHPERSGPKIGPKKGTLRSPDPSVSVRNRQVPSEGTKTSLRDGVSKEEQLEAIEYPRSAPTEEVFAQFLSTTNHLEAHRPSLYEELRDAKWHKWTGRAWTPIRDWRGYIRALDEKMGETFV